MRRVLSGGHADVPAKCTRQPSVPAKTRRVRNRLDGSVGVHEKTAGVANPQPDQVGVHPLTHDQRELCRQVPRVAPKGLADGQQGQGRCPEVPVEMRERAVHEPQVFLLPCLRVRTAGRRVEAIRERGTLALSLLKLGHASSQGPDLFRQHRQQGLVEGPGDDWRQEARGRRERSFRSLGAGHQLHQADQFAVEVNGDAGTAQPDGTRVSVDLRRTSTGADVNRPLLSTRRSPAHAAEPFGAARMDRRGQHRHPLGSAERRETRYGRQAGDLAKGFECRAHPSGESDDGKYRPASWHSGRPS